MQRNPDLEFAVGSFPKARRSGLRRLPDKESVRLPHSDASSPFGRKRGELPQLNNQESFFDTELTELTEKAESIKQRALKGSKSMANLYRVPEEPLERKILNNFLAL